MSDNTNTEQEQEMNIDWNGYAFTLSGDAGWVTASWVEDGSVYAETPAYVHSDGTAMVPFDCTGGYDSEDGWETCYSHCYADGAAVGGSNWLDVRTGEPGLVIDGVPVLGPFKRGFSYGAVR
jgi:hypothetical protein